MDEFAEWLKRQLAVKGWKPADLARRTNISASAISRWRDGQGHPNKQSCAAIADAFGVALEDVYRAAGFLGPEGSRPAQTRSLKEHVLEFMADLPVVQIPIHDQVASAGFGQEVLDYAYWSPPEAAGRNIVGIKVHGDSMEPDIHDGDVIFMDREEAATPGRTVVATIGDEVVVKKLRSRANKLWLVGTNGKEIDASGAKIEGVVLKLLRDVR